MQWDLLPLLSETFEFLLLIFIHHYSNYLFSKLGAVVLLGYYIADLNLNF